jgi:hypothetical protein
VQGAAAAQNGISVVQPNVGRLHDWYNRHPGVIRDPSVRFTLNAAAFWLPSCGGCHPSAQPLVQCTATLQQCFAAGPVPAPQFHCILRMVLQAPREMAAMAKAGYGANAINPGLLLVEKIYSYIQV